MLIYRLQILMINKKCYLPKTKMNNSRLIMARFQVIGKYISEFSDHTFHLNYMFLHFKPYLNYICICMRIEFFSLLWITLNVLYLGTVILTLVRVKYWKTKKRSNTLFGMYLCLCHILLVFFFYYYYCVFFILFYFLGT